MICDVVLMSHAWNPKIINCIYHLPFIIKVPRNGLENTETKQKIIDAVWKIFGKFKENVRNFDQF